MELTSVNPFENNIRTNELIKSGIEDYDEAMDFIKQTIEKEEWPIISVPQKYRQAVKQGIKPHSTWIGEEIIAGTISRTPYNPEDEKRRCFKIKVSPQQIEPRFTGPDKKFHGVILFKGPIQPEAMLEVLCN